MECKKCSYFEAKREITNTGKVLVGFCKLRGKHITDLTIKKEFCKDRATVDIPAGEKATPIKPEPSLYTDREKEMLSRERKPATPSAPSKSESPTFAELAAKRGLVDIREKPSNYAIGRSSHAPVNEVLPSKPEISQDCRKVHQKSSSSLGAKNPAFMKGVPSPSKAEIKRNNRQPENVQIVPPMKLSPEDAIRLLEQQLSGKIKASFSKYGVKTSNSDAEKDLIRKAVWGGGT